MLTIHYSLDATACRRIYFEVLRRRNGHWLWAIAVAFGLGVLLTTSVDTAWDGGMAIGAATTLCAFFYVGYRGAQKTAGTPVTVELGDTSVAIATTYLRSEIPWAAFRNMDEHTESISLVFGPNNQALSLPQAALTDEARTFIRSHLPRFGEPRGMAPDQRV